jgi:hypothetical protein
MAAAAGHSSPIDIQTIRSRTALNRNSDARMGNNPCAHAKKNHFPNAPYRTATFPSGNGE